MKDEQTEQKKVSKIQTILSETGSAVLKRRAGAIANEISLAYTSLITQQERVIQKMQNELDYLTDMSVKSQDSLVPGHENFNPEQWIQKRVDLRIAIEIEKEKLSYMKQDQTDMLEPE